jgi:hypothetical protein
MKKNHIQKIKPLKSTNSTSVVKTKETGLACIPTGGDLPVAAL